MAAAGDRRGHLIVSARDLLESVPDAVVGVDGAGRIAFVNMQAERRRTWATGRATT